MRLTPAPAKSGMGAASGDGEGADTGFASLLAAGTPGASARPDASATPRRTVAELLAAVQRAISRRAAPTDTDATQAAADDAAPAGTDDAKSGDGKSADSTDDDTSASPADLIPLIEAQSAAPVAVAPPPAAAPTPKDDTVLVPASAERTLPRGAGDPRNMPIGRLVEAVKHAEATTQVPASAQVPATAQAQSSPQADASGSLAAALVLASGSLPAPATSASAKAPSLKAASGRIGLQTEAPSTAAAPTATPADAEDEAGSGSAKGVAKPAATAVPVPHHAAEPARTAPDMAPARPDAEAQPQAQAQARASSPAPAQAEPNAVSAAAPPPFAAPDPAQAIQAVMGAIADRIAAPQPAPADGAAQQAPIADRVMTHHLDLARDSAWLDRLARDIASSGATDGPMRFRLNPETLGHMHVELTQGDRGTSIRLTVDNEAARGIVADAQPRLVAEARAQGVRIAETHVDLAGGQNGQASDDPRRQADLREPVFLRTASGGERESEASPAPRRSAGSDRYA
jgi:flagellar hook-length control protein FliK